MKTLSQFALTIAAAALLAACGGSQMPIGAPGVTAKTFTKAARADGGTSWMKSGTSGQDLLYVTAVLGLAGVAYVYSFPQGELVGELTGFFAPVGACVDSAGDVFIVAYSDSALRSNVIYEYAHGGTSPINTLSNPGNGIGCASDPTTGNLAVANISDPSNKHFHFGDVAIYAAAQGTPTIYSSATFIHFYFCGYDDAGNLYVSASNYSQDELVWIPRKKSSIEQVRLDKQILGGYQIQPSVQWDGTHMTVSSLPPYASKSGVLSVYRMSIANGKAKVIGTTRLLVRKNRHRGETWISGSTIVGVDLHNDYASAGIWAYPKGGEPEKQIQKIVSRDHGGNGVGGVTVSPGSSRRCQTSLLTRHALSSYVAASDHLRLCDHVKI
jgi:hypothetical protein